MIATRPRAAQDQSHPVRLALGAGNSAGPTSTPASHGGLLDVAALLKPGSPPPLVSEEASSNPVYSLRLQLGLLTQVCCIDVQGASGCRLSTSLMPSFLLALGGSSISDPSSCSLCLFTKLG